MSSPYTVSQLLAGSISQLLEQQRNVHPYAKLLFMIYGYDQAVYRQCWDLLKARYDGTILLVSIEQLPETDEEEYPSGGHTVIHFRNIERLPVVCFDNGSFEGYSTSLGKIERIGNQVTGAFASCLIEWMRANVEETEDPRKREMGEVLNTPLVGGHTLQLLFDTVKPHLERVVAYFNALYAAPELTRATWGEKLSLLGLFRDSALMKTPSEAPRSLVENHLLSQVGYWQRETNEHIKSSDLGNQAKAVLLGVLADSTRLGQAHSLLDIAEVRKLIARSRRSAEKIAFELIRNDVSEAAARGDLVQIEQGSKTLSDKQLNELSLSILEFYRDHSQYIPPNSESTQMEWIQHYLSALRPKTLTAIHKALVPQSPIVTTNLFLGILRCLLVWKEEHETPPAPQSQQGKSRASDTALRVAKLSVQGVQLLPDPSPDKWGQLVKKVDRQIREKWEELIHDAAISLSPSREFEGQLPFETHKRKGSKRSAKRQTSRTASSQARATSDEEEAAVQEEGTNDEALQEQLHDLEVGDARSMALDIAVSIEAQHKGGGAGQQNTQHYSFHLEYDPVESLLLQKLIYTPVPLYDTSPHFTGSLVQKNEIPFTSLREGEEPPVQTLGHSSRTSYSVSWTCSSEGPLSADIRSMGLALLRKQGSLQVALPQVPHSHLVQVQELYQRFTELTMKMREQGEGLAYFSTYLLPALTDFLTAYVHLLVAAKQTEQDAFHTIYGAWISQLFTIDLTKVKQTSLTYVVTPFHPLQLRWRRTYETFLVQHIQNACLHPDVLTGEFLKELENLSSTSIPGVLPTSRAEGARAEQAPTRLESRTSVPAPSENGLSYPWSESKTGLFSGYRASLPRLQHLPSELARKIEQFFRVYPSAVDRANISVICPGDLAVEGTLSQMCEEIQRKYVNAGFFIRLFTPERMEPPSQGQLTRNRYDEDQGELRVRSRYHLFPRTEFVRLQQDLLKTPEGQRFLFGDAQPPTQHLFLLLDYLGVTMKPAEIPLDVRGPLDDYIEGYGEIQGRSRGDPSMLDLFQEGPLDALTILLQQGQETYDEQSKIWTRGVVDSRDAFSLLYYTIAARSQGRAHSLYRYECHLSKLRSEALGTDALVKLLHKQGIWVGIVDRAITREFFRANSPEDHEPLVLIDFHKGVGPQREYNITISSTWTYRVKENVNMALQQIAPTSHQGFPSLKSSDLAGAMMRQLQDISGGLALQLAATDANTKGLLGLLMTALESTRYLSPASSQHSSHREEQVYTTVIPLDDHNDWFEREEARTDLLIVQFASDSATGQVHLYFGLIECKFDESVQRASKGIGQLEETTRRLRKRFAPYALEYPFRLRDLAEAVRSLACTYRRNLPDYLLERLRANDPSLVLHVDDDEIACVLALYQIADCLPDVQSLCEQSGYRLLCGRGVTLEEVNMQRKGEQVCLYRSAENLGEAFDRFVQWITERT